jgi:hypothetical protein
VEKTSKVASDPPPTSPFFATLPPAEIQKFDSTFDFSPFGKSKKSPGVGYECVQKLANVDTVHYMRVEMEQIVWDPLKFY